MYKLYCIKLRVMEPEKQDPGRPTATTGHGHDHHGHKSGLTSKSE
jgi:hypothetical protein